MLPTYKPVIGSLEELTENSEYSFVVKKYSSIWANMIVRNSLWTSTTISILKGHILKNWEFYRKRRLAPLLRWVISYEIIRKVL
jgi:hypothetical protein